MKEIIKRVLQMYYPKKEYIKRVEKIVNEFKKEIEKEVGKKVLIAGSFSRKTFLKKVEDVDLFVLFKNEGEMKQLKKFVVKYKHEKIKGSREYYRVKYKGITFELVPVLDIEKEKIKNSIDISRYHYEYLKDKINERIRKEIIITKAFLKANNLYGAESYKNAISGYATELLILHFKKFINFVKFFSEAKEKVFIDIEGHYKNVEEAIKTLGESKSYSPVILIDPVMKERNALASLSKESFYRLIFVCKLFLINPSIKFFKKKEETINDIKKFAKKIGGKVIVVKVKKSYSNKDVFFSKLKKILKIAEKKFFSEGYTIYKKGIIEKEKAFYLVINKIKYKKVKGPSIYINKENFKKYIKKNKLVVLEGENLFSIKKVKNIKEILKDIKKKIKSYF